MKIITRANAQPESRKDKSGLKHSHLLGMSTEWGNFCISSICFSGCTWSENNSEWFQSRSVNKVLELQTVYSEL